MGYTSIVFSLENTHTEKISGYAERFI